jgi:hypothetical protein
LIDPADAITPLNMNIHLLIYTPLSARHATGRQTSKAGGGRRSSMALGVFVDWRGNTINRQVHGGVRAAWFLYGN